MDTVSADITTLGHRIRHYRTQRGLTLDDLGEAAGVAGSQLSLIENGKREPRLSLLQAIASALDVELSDLLSSEPPNSRAALEIELARAQRGSLYASLGLPPIKPTKGTPTETLEAIVGLHRELAKRANQAIATPEEARRANTELRERMRAQNNYIPEIEELAEDRVRAAGHTRGALTHREVSVMAEQLGLRLIYVNDLPHSARSVTDLANGRIYLPPASIPGGHGLRSMALQAMAHRLLRHEPPESYADFLRQRLEINYFAACCLMPRDAAVGFLQERKRDKDLAVEDFRDAFGVTHEAAALRLTNLATSHLDMTLHFLRVGDDGALYKGYENDGLPLPTDVTGAIEGQLVCRQWSARSAFTHTNRTTELYQYTDTPAGTYWCATQTGTTSAGGFSISVGVPFAEAKWFRGRETTVRAVSRCPDESCCKRPAHELEERWSGKAWPSARLHAHILSPLPSGSFPGVDDNEVYAFLETHSAE
ncbi:helix-turn-helix domain-containing protein [Diaminobutyricibacter tongyongensis]|uniref:Helix-turn-helix domain-containing protein n=1 Tax=Leifsonia tongyongensis TaxID=1268043 RepID=A0A6L9Y0W8_9MICO|nr:helix-turn-helix transcriptional regulator [Diaminobutyricibacter tongyongensis]NEN06934.1 helix-turn-helix domain-containing protein [Diaminobutyricibacter tongyongensis]